MSNGVPSCCGLTGGEFGCCNFKRCRVGLRHNQGCVHGDTRRGNMARQFGNLMLDGLKLSNRSSKLCAFTAVLHAHLQNTLQGTGNLEPA